LDNARRIYKIMPLHLSSSHLEPLFDFEQDTLNINRSLFVTIQSNICHLDFFHQIPSKV
jgi:hypothetical protein